MQIRAITPHVRAKCHSLSIARVAPLVPPVDGLYRSILDSIHDTFDLVGRWGGEEFMVVTAATTLRDLQQLAERLRALVERTELDVDGRNLSVTVSIGGSLARVGDDVSSLVARADDHLYESKRDGRNRSTVR